MIRHGRLGTRHRRRRLHRLARRRRTRARAAGEEWLRSGTVAALTVAGGQASRLGWEAPKGVFPIGPLSGWSLFEIFARKLRASAARYGFRPQWYLMTSPQNDAQTRAFFESRGVKLAMSPNAARAIAQAARRQPRLGARALKEVFRRVIRDFEFDPAKHAGQGVLLIDQPQVTAALGE